MLLSVGEGTVPGPYVNLIEIPEQIVCKDLKEVENKVYDNFVVNYANLEYLFGWAIMSTTNERILQKNFKMIQQLPGEITISESIVKCIEDLVGYDIVMTLSWRDKMGLSLNYQKKCDIRQHFWFFFVSESCD